MNASSLSPSLHPMILLRRLLSIEPTSRMFLQAMLGPINPAPSILHTPSISPSP